MTHNCVACNKDICFIEFYNCFGFCKPCQDGMILAACDGVWKMDWPQLGQNHALENAL